MLIALVYGSDMQNVAVPKGGPAPEVWVKGQTQFWINTDNELQNNDSIVLNI